MTRIIDIAVSVVALVLAAPVLALAAIGIKTKSPGPVFYRAERAGQHGVPFEMFKLRTMHVAPGNGRITSADDPRVFPLGRRLRRFKLDEFPQLWNVLRGQMALVGPRPEDSSIVRDHYDAAMRRSLEVPPGVTGPGSLRYYVAERNLPTDPLEAERVYLDELLRPKLALDMVYVRHRNVRYQVQLILRTVAAISGADQLFTGTVAWEAKQAAMIEAEIVSL